MVVPFADLCATVVNVNEGEAPAASGFSAEI